MAFRDWEDIAVAAMSAAPAAKKQNGQEKKNVQSRSASSS